MPEREMDRLLAGLAPRLDPTLWVFVQAPAGAAAPDSALMVFREAEGVTWILPPDDARRRGLPDAPPFTRITLAVHSDLEAVGLTGAVAGALAAAGIAANVVAALHHDHVFVPETRAAEALARLEALAKRAA